MPNPSSAAISMRSAVSQSTRAISLFSKRYSSIQLYRVAQALVPAVSRLRTPDLAPQIRGAGENRPAQNWRLKGLRRVVPRGKLGHAAASVASFPRWSDAHQRGPGVPTTGRAGGVLPRADAGVSAWRKRSE